LSHKLEVGNGVLLRSIALQLLTIFYLEGYLSFLFNLVQVAPLTLKTSSNHQTIFRGFVTGFNDVCIIASFHDHCT